MVGTVLKCKYSSFSLVTSSIYRWLRIIWITYALTHYDVIRFLPLDESSCIQWLIMISHFLLEVEAFRQSYLTSGIFWTINLNRFPYLSLTTIHRKCSTFCFKKFLCQYLIYWLMGLMVHQVMQFEHQSINASLWRCRCRFSMHCTEFLLKNTLLCSLVKTNQSSGQWNSILHT